MCWTAWNSDILQPRSKHLFQHHPGSRSHEGWAVAPPWRGSVSTPVASARVSTETSNAVLNIWIAKASVLQLARNGNLLRVFGDSFGDVGCLHLLTEVLRRGFCRDAFLGLQPSVNLHSHPLETTGTLVDDAEASVQAGVAGRWGWVAKAVGVANSILELVDLAEFGLQLSLELM